MHSNDEERRLKLLKVSNSPNKKSYIQRYLAISAIVFLEKQGLFPILKFKFIQILKDIAGFDDPNGRIRALSNEERGHHHDIVQCIDGNINIKDDIKTYLLSLNWELSSENKLRIIKISANEHYEIEQRYARLTYNTSGYQEPSGKYGKSKSKDSFEYKYGYGHEEWLFDTAKIIDDFHYGFLEPIRQQHQSYESNIYNIWLYTINSEINKYYYIGRIKKVHVIDENEAEETKKVYLENGWLEEMNSQIRAVGARESGYMDRRGLDLFNVKFNPQDIIQIQPIDIPINHPICKVNRYTFGKFSQENDIESKDFLFMPNVIDGNDDNDINPSFHIREPRIVENRKIHKIISSNLSIYLRSKYGESNVGKEQLSGYGANKIDIVVKNEKEYIFYEIKTHTSITMCIREALGQLLEYSYFPDKKTAAKLIIISQHDINDDVKYYLEHIRNLFKIPIYYQSFNLKTKLLSEEY